MSKDVSVRKFNKFFQKEQSYSRIRSRFSDRSQGIMQSLAFGNLKMQKKNVQFLPQLSFKRLNKKINKTLIVRTRKSITKTNMKIVNPE